MNPYIKSMNTDMLASVDSYAVPERAKDVKPGWTVCNANAVDMGIVVQTRHFFDQTDGSRWVGLTVNRDGAEREWHFPHKSRVFILEYL